MTLKYSKTADIVLTSFLRLNQRVIMTRSLAIPAINQSKHCHSQKAQQSFDDQVIEVLFLKL